MNEETQHPTLSQSAYLTLRQKIMAGEYSPYTRLAEASLGRQIGMSRTPIREALAKLDHDGLIRKVNGGYYVAQPDFSDIADLYELRILLEEHGIARGIGESAYDMDALHDIQQQWLSLRDAHIVPNPNFVLRDENFHVSLLRAAGNQVIGDHLESVNVRIRSVRMYDFITADRIDWTIDTHLAILESVLKGDMSEARDRLHQHILKSMQVVEHRAGAALRQMMNALSSGMASESETQERRFGDESQA